MNKASFHFLFSIFEFSVPLCQSKPVDHASHTPSPKPIINIHHAHIRSAAIQHRQQRRQPPKTRSITSARRHRNHRSRHQPRHHARQRPLHSRHANNHPRRRQFLTVLQQPVQPRHSHVINRLSPVPHDLRRHQRFFRHGNIARPRGYHQNQSLPMIRRAARNSDRARELVKSRRPRQLLHRRKNLLVRARDQYIVRRLRPQHSPRNLRHLLRRFLPRKNHFRKSLPQRAMVVNLREPQILVRPLAQLLHRAFHRQAPALHRLQKFSYVPFIHGVSSANSAF